MKSVGGHIPKFGTQIGYDMSIEPKKPFIYYLQSARRTALGESKTEKEIKEEIKKIQDENNKLNEEYEKIQNELSPIIDEKYDLVNEFKYFETKLSPIKFKPANAEAIKQKSPAANFPNFKNKFIRNLPIVKLDNLTDFTDKEEINGLALNLQKFISEGNIEGLSVNCKEEIEEEIASGNFKPENMAIRSTDGLIVDLGTNYEKYNEYLTKIKSLIDKITPLHQRSKEISDTESKNNDRWRELINKLKSKGLAGGKKTRFHRRSASKKSKKTRHNRKR